MPATGPWYYSRIFIGVITFVIGLLIGMYLIPGSMDVAPGDPIISTIDTKTNEISVPVVPTGVLPPTGWVTTEFVGPNNKAVRITSGGVTTYHYCNERIKTTYLTGGTNVIMPLIDGTVCNPAAPTIPGGTYLIPPGSLQTYSGSTWCFDPTTGTIRSARLDVYCFKDTGGNQTGITLVLME